MAEDDDERPRRWPDGHRYDAPESDDDADSATTLDVRRARDRCVLVLAAC